MTQKKYVVMLFETQLQLGLGNEPNKWVNTANVYFTNGAEALDYYANTPCPASQLLDAEDDYALQCKMGDMLLNFRDEKWLDENLYPYL